MRWQKQKIALAEKEKESKRGGSGVKGEERGVF